MSDRLWDLLDLVSDVLLLVGFTGGIWTMVYLLF